MRFFVHIQVCSIGEGRFESCKAVFVETLVVHSISSPSLRHRRSLCHNYSQD